MLIHCAPQVFGNPGGDSVVYFRLEESKTIELSTCDSEAATDLSVLPILLVDGDGVWYFEWVHLYL